MIDDEAMMMMIPSTSRETNALALSGQHW